MTLCGYLEAANEQVFLTKKRELLHVCFYSHICEVNDCPLISYAKKTPYYKKKSKWCGILNRHSYFWRLWPHFFVFLLHLSFSSFYWIIERRNAFRLLLCITTHFALLLQSTYKPVILFNLISQNLHPKSWIHN